MIAFLSCLIPALLLLGVGWYLGREYQKACPCSCARVTYLRHASEHHRPARMTRSHDELRLLDPSPFDYESQEPA